MEGKTCVMLTEFQLKAIHTALHHQYFRCVDDDGKAVTCTQEMADCLYESMKQFQDIMDNYDDRKSLLDNKSVSIKDLRMITGMNQKEFSETFKIPYQTLKKWEMEATDKTGGKERERKAPEYFIDLLKQVVFSFADK